MRVDYLRDASPEIVEKVLSALELPQLRRLCSFLVAAALVSTVGWAVEHARVNAARMDLSALVARVNRANTEAARVQAEEASLRTWQSTYRYIERARVSGTAVSTRIALIANALPLQTWLTSLQLGADGVDLEGRGLNLRDIGDALRSVTASRLVEVRAPSDPHARILEFEMRATDR